MKKFSHISLTKDSPDSPHHFLFQMQDSTEKDSKTLQDSSETSSQTYTPGTDEIGIRADVFVAKTLQISRSKAEKLFAKGQISLNGIPLNKQGMLLKSQDKITIYNLFQPTLHSIKSENFEIPILYQDEDLLVLNKPAGLIVHRANEQDKQFTLVDWLQQHNFSLSNLGNSYRCGIVHRLDKGTSGAMVIAKTNLAHENLKLQLQTRQMGRYYLCVIDKPLKESQIVDSPLVRHSRNRLKYVIANKNNPNAKSAKTAFFKIASTNHKQFDYELIGAKLFSGRTHQIRVHLSSLNRHILGDFFYGYQESKSKISYENTPKRILLHSHLLYLQHPKNGEILHIYAPLFKEMQDILNSNFDLKSYQDSNSNLLFPLDKIYQSIFTQH